MDISQDGFIKELTMNLLAVALLSAASASAVVGEQRVERPTVTAKDSLITVERNIVQKTNAERARHGLPPLAIDNSLMGSARSHAQWMARNRVMQHTSAMVAENIASGQSSSGEVVGDWMQSPGHRANILNGSYRRIGVAAYRGFDGQVYWVQQFLW